MIDLYEEELVTFRQAAAGLPSRPHVSTLQRWRTRGVNGVRLESVRVGGRRYTSLQALQRFAARIEEGSRGNNEREPTEQIQRAENYLRGAGVIGMPNTNSMHGNFFYRKEK